MRIISQISAIRSLPGEFWAAVAALLTGAALVAKKLLSRSLKSGPEHITRTEFHSELEKTRDRIGASYLALADKIDQNHQQTTSAIDRIATTFERRLDTLDSLVARLDERTTSAHQSTNPTIH